MADCGNVETTRCNVGGDEHGEQSVTITSKRSFALTLGYIAVDFLGANITSAKFLADFSGFMSGASKDQNRVCIWFFFDSTA